MYKRYEEILIERSRENRVVTVEKRRAPEIKPPDWEKHVKPRVPKWKFNKSEFIEKAPANNNLGGTMAPEGTPRFNLHTHPNTQYHGSRDCGWYNNSDHHACVHLASKRR